MQKTQEIEINQTTYTIQEILATDRIFLGIHLAKLNAHMLTDGDATSFLSSQDPASTTKLIKSLLDKALQFPRFKKDNDFENHFSDNFSDIPELIGEIIELNFGETIENIKKKFLQTEKTTPKSGDQESSEQDTNE
jgi:hypothetical protein